MKNKLNNNLHRHQITPSHFINKKVFFIVLCMLFISLAYAGIVLQDEDIERNYVVGENIRGKIILNLTDIDANALVESNFGGSISLLKLIRLSQINDNWQCNTLNCETIYKPKEKITSPLSGNELFLGLKAIGKDIEISALDFILRTDALPSCENQVSIFTSENEEIMNPKIKNDSLCGEKNYGCFESSNDNLKATLNAEPVCELMNLTNAPGYLVGARITNSTEGNAEIKMELNKVIEGAIESLGECILPSLSQETQEVSCVISKPIRKGEYYLCISASSKNYKIRAENRGKICGTASLGSEEFSFDYEVFAQALKYDSPMLSIRNESLAQIGIDIEDYANSYVQSAFEGNCTSECLVPFKIKSSSAQRVLAENGKIEYSSQGTQFDSNEIYLLEQEEPKITGNVEIQLAEAEFSVSETSRILRLSIGGNSIVSIPINVTRGFTFGLIPSFAYLGIDTRFSILSQENITEVNWDFGDDTTEISNERSTTHRYLESGNYTITIEATNSRGIKVTRAFDIYAGNVDGAFDIAIRRKNETINNIKEKIKTIPEFARSRIENALNLSAQENLFNEILRKVNSSANDSIKIEAINEINSIEIPNSLSLSAVEKLPLALGFSNIDTSYIENISQIELNSEKKEEFKNNLIFWSNKNYAPEVERKEIIAEAGMQRETIGVLYKVFFNKKGDVSDEVFFIIDYPKEQIAFSREYGQKSINNEASSATYFSINEDSVEFFIDADVGIEELGMHISPRINVIGNYGERNKFLQEFPTARVIIYIILLIIGALAVYIILQEWYKRNYESHLFRNKDELYNLLAFIYNARQSQMQDDDSRRKLANAGWSHEQLSYAFKKIDGKRTGMWEIPVFRSREQKLIREEIAKRQGGDARFIKRPFV